MNKIAYLAAGVASADRAKARMLREGRTPGGHQLWSEEELSALRRLYPDYQAVVRALGGRRSYYAVRNKAQEIGLAPTRTHWTGEQVLRLRRAYMTGDSDQIRAAVPGRTMKYINSMASYFGFRRPRKRFAPTGIPVIDQIRDRCYELHLSMVDLDAMAGTGTYFAHNNWRSGHVSGRAIVRAVKALDGELYVAWRDHIGHCQAVGTASRGPAAAVEGMAA